MRIAPLVLILASAADAGADATAQLSFGRVISELDPASASSAAVWLETVEARYRRLGYPRLRPETPLRALLLESSLELAPFVGSSFNPARDHGLSLRAQDRHYVLVGWDPPGNPYRALAHELAHLVDPHRNTPLWFREGFAEYLSRLDETTAGAVSSAPPPSIATLMEGGWIPLAALLKATRGSATARLPGFYPECWLVVAWLSSQGLALDVLRPAALERLASERGLAAVETDLLQLAEQFSSERAPLFDPPRPTAPAFPAAAWELPLALAGFQRTVGRVADAEARLRALAEDYPDTPAIQAELAALAFDRGRYDEAERRLRVAVEDARAEPLTFYRLALLLLRPVPDATPDREDEAVLFAQLAVDQRPEDPRFRLTLAQALMAAEQWAASARELQRLAEVPGWRPQASVELAELERRRAQTLRRVEAPQLAVAEPLRLPPGVAPGAAALTQPPAPTWPPAGAAIIAGKIAAVDCSGGEKIIVLASRLYHLRFRESRERPAHLFSPPLKWRAIPCGTYGWYVNLAYRPSTTGDVRGEVLAILF